MLAWFFHLKEYVELLILGAIYFATLASLWLYKRRQLSRRAQIEQNILRRQYSFLQNGIFGLVISLLFLSLFCCVEIFTSASVVTILSNLALFLIGVSLLSGFLILVEKSKWRRSP